MYRLYFSVYDDVSFFSFRRRVSFFSFRRRLAHQIAAVDDTDAQVRCSSLGYRFGGARAWLGKGQPDPWQWLVVRKDTLVKYWHCSTTESYGIAAAEQYACFQSYSALFCLKILE